MINLAREFFVAGAFLLYITNIIFAVFVVFFEKKNPGVTWAWLMVLVLVPYFGFLFYMVLGFEGRKHKVFGRKQQEDIKLFDEFVKKYPQYATDEKDMDEIDGIVPVENTAYLNNLVEMNKNSGRSPYRQNNSVQVFHEGNSKFESLLKDIKNAKSFIHMEYYLMHDDALGKHIMEALAEKAKQGVEVKLLYDGMGNARNKPFFKKLLTNAGGEVRTFLPPRGIRVNYRDHRKIAVIDGKTGYVGGLNIGDEYVSLKKRFGFWRDSHIRVTGDSVKDLELRFMMDWNFTKGDNIGLDEKYFPPAENQDSNVNMQIISSGPDTQWNSILNSYFKMVTEANKNVYIATPYFVPDDSLLVALRTAALSGIDVRIIIPGKPDHPFVHSGSLSYLGELMEAGVRCYEYKKGFIHAKVMTIDGIITSVGTANMDIRSFSLNFEVNAFLYDKDVTAEFEKQFLIDFEDCEEIKPDVYKNRGNWEKAKEAFARLISPLL